MIFDVLFFTANMIFPVNESVVQNFSAAKTQTFLTKISTREIAGFVDSYLQPPAKSF